MAAAKLLFHFQIAIVLFIVCAYMSLRASTGLVVFSCVFCFFSFFEAELFMKE